MKKYKIFLVSVLVIVVSMVGVGITVFSKEGDKYDVVFYVNEEPVYLGEFLLYFNNNKIKVFKEFSNEENKDNFWDIELLKGKTALDIAKILTVEDLKEIKSVQITAKKYNVIENIDYKSFVENLNKENERREKALNNNEIIYGPEKYEEDEYYSYLLENLKNELKNAIKVANDVSEEEIEIYYKENKESLYKIEDSIVVNIISTSYVDNEGMVDEKTKELSLEKIEMIKDNYNKYKQINMENDNSIKSNIYEFKNETKRNDDKFLPELKEEALKLQIGEGSKVIEFNGAYNFMICDKRQNQGYKALEEVRGDIEDKILTDIYRLQLKLTNSNCEVKLNTKVFNAIG